MKSARALDATTWVSGRSVVDTQFVPVRNVLSYVVSDATSYVVLVPLDGGAETPIYLEPSIRRSGGCHSWLPDGSGFVYIATDGTLQLYSLDELSSRAVTKWPDSLSTVSVSPDGSHAVYVVDTHDVAVVSLHDGPQWPVRVSSGADFVFDPVWSPDSQWIAWHEWDVPDMPWDGGRIAVRKADMSGPILTVAGGPGVAVHQPRFSPDGSLLSYICDQDGWMNVWAVETESFEHRKHLVDENFEHNTPAWGPGMRTYAWVGNEAIAYCRNDAGLGSLRLFHLTTSSSEHLAEGMFTNVTATLDHVAGISSGPKHAQRVDCVALAAKTVTTLGVTAPFGIEARAVEPEVVEWQTSDGVTLHGRLYRTTTEPAPTIVWLHGGPCGQSPAMFYARWNYFIERGWSIFVVDYRGSTGWGRDFQQAMREQWGEIDVADTISGVQFALQSGWAIEDRVVLYGTSSAGTTALLALEKAPDLFAAGVVMYPLTDMLAFGEDTWRFEAHYLDTLVGALPESYQECVDRSPITHVQDLKAPVLILHGDSDQVVPLEQATSMARAIERNGGTVEFHVYEGEGHGWRSSVTQADELRRVETFLSKFAGGGASKGERS